MESKILDAHLIGGLSAIAGHETRRSDRVSGLVGRMTSLRLPNAAVSRGFRFAAEGATDKELDSMRAQSAERALETAKAHAYKLVGFGLS